MARPLRIEYDGAWYHVLNRGAGRRAVYATDEQRRYFLALLAEAHTRFNAEWHAYCLMGNHYHLLVRTPEANLNRIMRHLNWLYTQYYNRSTGRDGPLFQGRYKAILVEAQAYLTQLSHYIHRNPVEAGVVTHLDRYRWSSYPAYIGRATRHPWLTWSYPLKSLATRRLVDAYQAYVAKDINAEIQVFYAQRNTPRFWEVPRLRRNLNWAGETLICQSFGKGGRSQRSRESWRGSINGWRWDRQVYGPRESDKPPTTRRGAWGCMCVNVRGRCHYGKSRGGSG